MPFSKEVRHATQNLQTWDYFWAEGWVEYNGRPIAGPYRRSTKASTETGARDWRTRETEFQIRRYLIGDEVNMTLADANMLYKASPVAAKQLIPIVEEIGHLSLGAITGARLKSLGLKLKPKACTDTWWREIVTPARAVINNAY